jgi:hypothetical protein
MRVSRLSSIVLALLAGQACMPAVMHGPRIDRGLTTGVAASYTAGPRRTRFDAGGAPYAYGPVGVDVGYGWVSDRTDGLGVRLGLHVPVPAAMAAQPDLYLQLPRRAVLGLDLGIGVAAIPINESIMPYAQLGVLRASGSGLYATYGRLMGPDPFNVNYSGRGPGADVPGIAFQNVNGRTTTRIFVTAIIAREYDRCATSTCRRVDDWSVASGMALQFRHRKDPR